jgi:hypothetical protein
MPRSEAPINLMQWCNLPGPSLPCKKFRTYYYWHSKTSVSAMWTHTVFCTDLVLTKRVYTSMSHSLCLLWNW